MCVWGCARACKVVVVVVVIVVVVVCCSCSCSCSYESCFTEFAGGA